MSNISVTEILRKHGKWEQSTPFVKLVAEEKDITDRHAYNLLREAVMNREVLRVRLDKIVLYGLPEFGPPPSSNNQSLHHFGFWDYLHKGPERERIRIKNSEMIILRLEREQAADFEIASLPSNLDELERVKRANEVKRKYGLL